MNEDGVLLSRDEAWTVLRELERHLGDDDHPDPATYRSWRVIAAKLLPDLFPDE